MSEHYCIHSRIDVVDDVDPPMESLARVRMPNRQLDDDLVRHASNVETIVLSVSDFKDEDSFIIFTNEVVRIEGVLSAVAEDQEILVMYCGNEVGVLTEIGKLL